MDDTYDDGLVHSHGWCSDAPAHTGTGRPLGCPEIPASTAPHAADEADPFDDGLVHGHSWAQS